MAKPSSDRLGYPVVTIPPSATSSPDAVIRFLIGQLVLRGDIDQEQAELAVCHVTTRERLSPTALAGGAAIPHSKTEVPHPMGIVGRIAEPIQWGTPGAVKVDEVCLLLLPVKNPHAHLRALEETVRAFSDSSP